MFSKKKNTSKVDLEQKELYDNARKRTLQKKRLFQHFIIFLVGAVFLIVLNVVIGYKEDFTPLGYNWFVWAILVWSFLFFVHLLNVFIVNSFMGKEWEAKHMDRLVKKQKEKIAQLQNQVEKDYPAKTTLRDTRMNKTSPDTNISPENPDQPYNT